MNRWLKISTLLTILIFCASCSALNDLFGNKSAGTTTPTPAAPPTSNALMNGTYHSVQVYKDGYGVGLNTYDGYSTMSMVYDVGNTTTATVSYTVDTTGKTAFTKASKLFKGYINADASLAVWKSSNSMEIHQKVSSGMSAASLTGKYNVIRMLPTGYAVGTMDYNGLGSISITYTSEEGLVATATYTVNANGRVTMTDNDARVWTGFTNSDASMVVLASEGAMEIHQKQSTNFTSDILNGTYEGIIMENLGNDYLVTMYKNPFDFLDIDLTTSANAKLTGFEEETLYDGMASSDGKVVVWGGEGWIEIDLLKH